MVNNPGQFGQLGEDEQARLAKHYVSNMKIIDNEGVPYTDLGMRKQIDTRGSRTILWPHTGRWVTTFRDGKRTSGRTVADLIKVLKHYG